MNPYLTSLYPLLKMNLYPTMNLDLAKNLDLAMNLDLALYLDIVIMIDHYLHLNDILQDNNHEIDLYHIIVIEDQQIKTIHTINMQVDKRIFAQLKQLYLILKRLDESTNEIKARLERLEKQHDERENDLSTQVIDHIDLC
ncbi:30812_t:CDS:2 [Racocetra persica]|uniref:30812_t:CDS:1 n=1 Tax=Racocetra persica TaxID=160502 RepID=A0ACA9LES8_9GLOM|nr:30812_t:CDS:2 [Racocetra persica]